MNKNIIKTLPYLDDTYKNITQNHKISYKILLVLSFVLLVLSFIILENTIQLLDRNLIEQVIVATSNPFVAFFIGLLASVLFQYNLFTILLIFIFATNQLLFLQSAIYMVLGMNLGISSTTTLISLGYVKRKKHFRKAVATSILQDILHLLSTSILILAEFFFQWLSQLSYPLLFIWQQGFQHIYWLNSNNLFSSWVTQLPYSTALYTTTLTLTIISIWLAIHAAISFLTQLYGIPFLQKFAQNKPQSDGQYFMIGLWMTAFIPSNIFVGKHLIPLLAMNKIRLEKIFVLLIGANWGMSFFIFLLAFFYSPVALHLALIHNIFHVLNIILLLPWVRLRTSIVNFARIFVRYILQDKLVGLAYILLTFFIIPFTLIFMTKDIIKIKSYKLIQQTNHTLLFENQNKSIFLKDFKKIYYKNTSHRSFNEKEKLFTKPLSIYKIGDALYINNQKWFLAPAGYQWEGNDEAGNFTASLDSMTRQINEHPRPKIDSCFLFTKKYDAQAQIPHATLKLHIDVTRKIIYKQQFLDAKGKILFSEELISIL